MDVNSFDRAASAANAFAVSLEDMAKVLRQFMSPFTIRVTIRRRGKKFVIKRTFSAKEIFDVSR